LAAGRDRTVPVLLDVNIGMNRTGVALESAAASYAAFDRIPGIELSGLHCFSGDFKITDLADRQKAVDRTASQIADIRAQITTAGYTCKVLVLSGTAVLKNYGIFPNAYLCPGTAFISDLQYHRIFPDYDYIPAAALLTRVISTPLPGQFTLDLGYKAIAADPKGTRGMILGYEDAKVCFQCEEHWTWHTDREDAPKVGDLLYVLPTHICPSITCYPRVLVVENHSVTGTWTVTARDRMLSV
jgi:D-serine deaminase-like pyridoxal phosphate-dependent protein